ncbi:acyl-CoA dehydrogenase family protein [Nocardioides sp. CN2-186]|uniref:acyl-CoA dehydrogenase family protein n=1 Tax=Nocardioides tweenelious TaxID=3156607 RepID=UPI0032B3330D
MTTSSSTAAYRSPWRDDETRALRDLALRFQDAELVPRLPEFTEQRQVDRRVWTEAGRLGLLLASVPEEYGGGGGDLRHDLALIEAEAERPGTEWGHVVHGIVAHYVLAYGTEEQRRRWLPRLASGELVGAVAMTEPGAGSDLQGIRTTAVRRGDTYVVNGAKTFISNGAQADLVLVVARTDPEAGSRGISIVAVETADRPGFARGRNLEKLGQHTFDTAELFFDDVVVPASDLLGGVTGQGFGQLMQQLPRERVLLGALAVGAMETAVRETVAYVKQRQAFGQPLMDFQNTRFVLAEAATKTHGARVFLDSCIQRQLAGELDGGTAAMCKWWLTDLQCEVIDQCLQLFGGYGYMEEFPIARLYANARVQKIYGGANEIMKEIVARTL